MDIKKRLGKEDIIEPKETVKVKNKLRLNEEDNLELLRLIPIVYEVLDSVMDRKYPYDEVLVDDNYLGLKVDLDYTELKRRIYKIGFKKKIQILTEVLPELLSDLLVKNKDFFLLNGLRCAKINDTNYIGSDYAENTILITYVNDKVYAIIMDKVNEPFNYEKSNSNLSEKELIMEVEKTSDTDNYKVDKEILGRLIDTSVNVNKEIEMPIVNEYSDDINSATVEEGKKLTSENISLEHLTEEEQKRLEDEVLDMLNSL